MDWGAAPQWITACVALGALVIGYVSIQSQREIARKRAAMDFFVKTEMDSHALAAHESFTAGVAEIPGNLDEDGVYADFARTTRCQNIRAYLNLHELMAVGIFQQVFDDNVCYYFWSGELERAFADTGALIVRIQRELGERDTYIELVKLARRWAART